MNKDAYMEALAVQLRKLPREDYVRAMEYFEEYFDEAGPENEQQAIGGPGIAGGGGQTDSHGNSREK